MARRKRARHEASFYEVQESFRENARLMTVPQHSFSSPSSSNSARENAKNVDASESYRRSPESVLYESPQVNLLHHEELSPELVPKVSRTKLSPEDECENDDVDEIREKIAMRGIERSESTLSEPRQVDLLLCHEQFSPDIPLKFSKNKKLGPRANHDDVEVGCENVARKRIEQSALNSADEHDVASNKVPDAKGERRPHLEGKWKDNRYGPEKMDDCHVLDKTLSISDDVAREIEHYLDEQSSTVVRTTDLSFTIGMTPLLVAVDELQSKYVMKPACLASLHTSDGYGCELSNNVQSSPDESEPLRSSLCETVEYKMYGHNADEMREKKSSSDDKNCNVASERNGRPSAANWGEFRKVLAYLQRFNRKIRGEDTKCGATLSSRHRFAHDNRKFRYVSIVTSPPPSSSSSLASSHASLLSPKNVKNRKSSAFASRNSAPPASSNECKSESNESPQRVKRTEPNPVSKKSLIYY